jgi:alanine racemase
VAATITSKAVRQATRPTWAEVSLEALRHNFRTLQKHVGTAVTICSVVKADAYGHGAVECALALEAAGATWFGVTSLDEAIPLREAGLQGRILLMTGFWRGEEEEVNRLGLTPTVWESWQVAALENVAAKRGGAKQAVHLKVDTGMSRLGVRLVDLPGMCTLLASSPHIAVEGFSTHLASSEVLDAPSVKRQLQRFEEAKQIVRQAGLTPAFLHAANSSAIISLRESWHSMVRPGLSLYGYYLPFQRAGREVSGTAWRLDVKPILTLKTRILSVRDAGANEELGYGGTHVTRGLSRIAVLPIGYADGLNRALSGRGRVIVRDHYAPIVGRISMDLTLVDVTGIPGVGAGDEVILLGGVNGLSISAREHAELANTISYEILCAISKRVPRKYQ